MNGIALLKNGKMLFENGQKLVVAPYPKDFGSYPSAFNKVSMAYAIKKNTKYPKEAGYTYTFFNI